MRRHPDHTPQHTPRLERIRCVQLKGRGAVVLMLNGTGRLRVRRGRADEFRFEGRGTPRFLSDDCILLAEADGRLEIRGVQLELEFSGGTAEIQLDGEFDVDPERSSKRSLHRGPPPPRAA